MFVKDIENTIISRLKTKIPELLVDSYPDKPEKFFEEFAHPKGAILVHYLGSSMSDSQALNFILQDRRADFGIILVTRDLNSHNGAYTYLDRIREALTGFRIDGCSKIYPTREEFLDEWDGIWQYGMNFSLFFKDSEIQEADEELPLFKTLSIDKQLYT